MLEKKQSPPTQVSIHKLFQNSGWKAQSNTHTHTHTHKHRYSGLGVRKLYVKTKEHFWVIPTHVIVSHRQPNCTVYHPGNINTRIPFLPQLFTHYSINHMLWVRLSFVEGPSCHSDPVLHWKYKSFITVQNSNYLHTVSTTSSFSLILSFSLPLHTFVSSLFSLVCFNILNTVLMDTNRQIISTVLFIVDSVKRFENIEFTLLHVPHLSSF